MKVLTSLFLLGLVSILSAQERKPNVIVILTDDQGYNDLACYGSKTIQTPNLDQMAKEGKKFTTFYVAASVCSPSRAALMTGCYPKRVGLHKGVLFPHSTIGLNPKEYTLGDHFKANGYATACIGKWHLGYQPEVLPRAQGFDSYYGIPYSNDMNYPDNKGKAKANTLTLDEHWVDPESTLTKWHAPLYQNEEIVELPVDQRTITRRYTDRAISFVKENQEKPFFLYLPHSMPHIPLYVPDDIYDPNPKRAYITVMEHIDAELGRLLDYLREADLAEDTIVVFTSDNGPWLKFTHQAGSAFPLRDGKGTPYEGGQRVPCIMWNPGRIAADSSSDEMLTTMDLLPTLAAMTDTDLPENFVCDGFDASGTILGDAASPRDELVYYSKKGELRGIRVGEWKLLEFAAANQKRPKQKKQTALYDLEEDISEKKNLAEEHPEIVESLRKRMIRADSEITENARPVWIAPSSK